MRRERWSACLIVAVLGLSGCARLELPSAGAPELEASVPADEVGTPSTTIEAAAATTVVSEPAQPAPELSWRPAGEPGVGGRLTSVVFDPIQPGRIHVGGDMLGLAHTDDGGTTWTRGLGAASYEIGTITIDRYRSGTIWVGSMGGPLASEDGGATWQLRREGMTQTSSSSYSTPIEVVLPDRLDLDAVWAFSGSQRRWVADHGSYGDIWWSGDAGGTWALAARVPQGGNVTAAGQLRDGRLVVAVGDGRVLLVTPGEWDWLDVAPSWLQGELTDLHVASDGAIWLTSAASDAEGWLQTGQVLRSSDVGATWDDVSDALPVDSQGELALTSGFGEIAVSETNPAVALVSDLSYATQAVYRTEDAGLSWSVVMDRSSKPPSPWGSGTGAETVAIHPADADEMLIASAEELWWSADAGTTWTALDWSPSGSAWIGRGLSGLVATDVAVADGRLVLAGFDGANPLIGGEGGYARPVLALDPWNGVSSVAVGADGAVVALRGDRDVFHGLAILTEVGGLWAVTTIAGGDLPEAGEWVRPRAVATHPMDAGVMTVVLGDRAWTSADGGSSWEMIETVGAARAVVYDPSGALFLGTEAGIEQAEGRRSALVPGTPAGVHRLRSWSSGEVWATGFEGGDQGLWRVSGGAVSRVLDLPAVADVAGSPEHPEVLVAVGDDRPFHDGLRTGSGVWLSVDGGRTWHDVSAGLPLRRVAAVAWDEARGVVIVGTTGGGFYTADLAEVLS